MSEHSVRIVEIEEVKPHPNADRLEIIPVCGWQAVTQKGNFKVGDRAVYIEPDYVVPTGRPEFAFLAKEGRSTHRLRAVRLRGELSFGLLIPAPESDTFMVGSDVMEYYGITRYVPPAKGEQGEGRGPNPNALPEDECPQIYCPKFDLENYQRYSSLLTPGEKVVITEKVHGTNAKYLYHNQTFYVGSRNHWLKPGLDTVYHRCLSFELRNFLMHYPDTIVFGEIAGPKIQSLDYGLQQPQFFGFAALQNGQWIDTIDLYLRMNECGAPAVPVIFIGPWNPDTMLEFAEYDSSILSAPDGHMREGLVISPFVERTDPRLGRVSLKYISNRYWLSEKD